MVVSDPCREVAFGEVNDSTSGRKSAIQLPMAVCHMRLVYLSQLRRQSVIYTYVLIWERNLFVNSAMHL